MEIDHKIEIAGLTFYYTLRYTGYLKLELVRNWIYISTLKKDTFTHFKRLLNDKGINSSYTYQVYISEQASVTKINYRTQTLPCNDTHLVVSYASQNVDLISILKFEHVAF